jgi:hypothetical protein
MASHKRRARVVAVVSVIVLCVVAIATFQIATRSGSSRHEATRSPQASMRYVDPKYGFSLVVDARFAKDTMPGDVLPGAAYYNKVWVAKDSATHGGQPLDYFGVMVVDKAEPASPRVIDRAIRMMLAHPRKVAAVIGGHARVIRVRRLVIDRAQAVAIDAWLTAPASGARVRSRMVFVATPNHTFALGGDSSPGNWKRNLPAFEAMIASFAIPQGER